jgi:hypothetical protein
MIWGGWNSCIFQKEGFKPGQRKALLKAHQKEVRHGAKYPDF